MVSKKKIIEKQDDFSKPASLTFPYNSLETERIEERSKSSISEAHLVENQKTKERFIRLFNRYKKPYKSKIQLGIGFNIYRGDSLSKLIGVIRKFASLLGWKAPGLSNDPLDNQAEKIMSELSKKDNEIFELRKQITQVSLDKDNFIEQIRKRHDEEIELLKKDSNRIKELSSSIEQFKTVLSTVEKEEEIQKFLEGKKWFFGTDVVSAKPKTRAGATMIFDFILTLTNGSQRIVELKLPEVKIIDNKDQISAAVAKGLDELIEYLKQTITIAYSTLPETEFIKEKKPRGILLIGRSENEKVIEKIKSWNYALHLVEIKTYDQLIADAETSIRQFKGELPL